MNRTLNKCLLTAVLLCSSAAAFAQQSLTDQIGAVREAQDQQDAAESAAQQAQQRHAAEQQRAAAALAEKRRAAEAALKKQKEDELLADKKRDQTYQDQLRALDVQEKTLHVDVEKAKAARENEYIDQELKEKEAKTDVIKSKADATRDLSSGAKVLLEKTGEAEVKSQSGLFQ